MDDKVDRRKLKRWNRRVDAVGGISKKFITG